MSIRTLTRSEVRLKLLARLQITADDILQLPEINSQLRMAASTFAARNLPTNPYFYLKCSDDDSARAILERYYSIPKSYRDILPIEAYCCAADVSPLAVIDIIRKTSNRIAQENSSILASAIHPSIVEKTVEMALTDDGYKDRELLHKAIGFLPTAKAPSTTVNVNANSSATAQSATLAAPPPERIIRRLTDRFNDARKALPPTSAVPIPEPQNGEIDPVAVLSGEFVDDEDEE